MDAVLIALGIGSFSIIVITGILLYSFLIRKQIKKHVLRYENVKKYFKKN